jgi:hypothetical protein
VVLDGMDIAAGPPGNHKALDLDLHRRSGGFTGKRKGKWHIV